MITCLECNKRLNIITAQHLKKCCGLTIREYRMKHNNASLVSPEFESTLESIQNKIDETESIVDTHYQNYPNGNLRKN